MSAREALLNAGDFMKKHGMIVAVVIFIGLALLFAFVHTNSSPVPIEVTDEIRDKELSKSSRPMFDAGRDAELY